MTFAHQVLTFTRALRPDWVLPSGFELLFPYSAPETMAALEAFYQKYYADAAPRTFILGINPGRFGAGVTGVPFTDPIRLEEDCGIPNGFAKRQELSSVFVYRVIAAFGGPAAFFEQFYISSLSPLGFVKAGKNCNYYDDRQLERAVAPHIVRNLETQLAFGARRHTAICLGEGQNYRYFQKLNDQHGFFEHILPLPHPRWVMQYRRKEVERYVGVYLGGLGDDLRIEAQS